MPARVDDHPKIRAFHELLRSIARKTDADTFADADFEALVRALRDPDVTARAAAMLEDKRIPLGALRAHLHRAAMVGKNEVLLRVLTQSRPRLEPLPQDEFGLLSALGVADGAALARNVRRVPAEALRSRAVRERVETLALDRAATAGTRIGAMNALARTRRPDVIRILRTGFETGEPAVRRSAIRSLRHLPANDATRNLFARAIAGTDVVAARHAVNGLRKDRSKAATRMLMRALTADDPSARGSAVDSLAGRKKSAGVIPALRAALRNERDPDVIKRIRRALR